MSTLVVIMMICDGMELLNIVQNDDDDEAGRYGSLVTPRCYVINDDLHHHFSAIFSNSFMTPPLEGLANELRNV